MRVAVLSACALLFVPCAAFAGRINLAWDPSPDTVTGYTVYWGTSPGNYPFSTNTTQTTHTILGLTNGVRYYFVVRAFNAGGFSTPSNEVNGLPTNLPPSITDPGDRTIRAGSFSLAITASDPDGDSLTYSATGLPSGLTINASTGMMTGTVAAGTYDITVTVNDGAAQASTTFTLTATANNSPTLQTPPNQNNDTDDVVSLQLVASDADGDTLTFSATGLPPGLTLNTSTGLITGTPTTVGTYPVTVGVNDGAGPVTRTFTWTIVALPPPVPISRWNFDEGAGTTAADTAGTRTGTLTNGAGWTTGRSGNAVTLDGIDDYVALPAFDVSGSVLTIAAWVRNSSLAAAEQRFISKTTGTTNYWTLGTAASALRFQLRTGTTTTTLDGGALSLNTWYHAVATYDGTTMRLYLNGVQVASIAKTGTISTDATVPVSIGRNPSGTGANYLQGAIDDVRLFTRSLNAAEVTTLFTEPVANRPPVITNPGNRTIKTGPYSLQISASDPDGDALTYSASGLPSSLTIGTSTGLINGTVAAGTYTITVSVNDGKAAPVSATFTLTVTPNNSPSLQTPPNQSNDTDDLVSLQLVASDADGDPLTFSATGLPSGVSLNTSTGLITGTPTTVGTYPVTVSVNDGAGPVTRAFTWTIVALPPPVPVSRWKFDEGVGTTATDSSGTRNGTLTNGALWTPGRSGSAVMLDGVNDYVALPAFDVTGTAVSIAAWVRNTNFSTADQRVLSKTTGTTNYWTLGTNASALRFRLRTGTSTTTLDGGALPVNTWYHAVATYDGTTMRLYLNGVQVASTAKTGTIATSATVAVSVGRNPSGTGANYLLGAVDDVRIFTRPLTAAEVATLYNEPPVAIGSFTDDPLIPGVHQLRMVHISELRARIDALRTVRGLGTMPWTTLVAGSTVARASHLTELRNALNAVYLALGRAAPVYTDNPLTAGMVIKAVHISELRAAVRALE